MAGWGAGQRSSHRPSPAYHWWWLATKWGRWLQGFWMILACSACWISASSYLSGAKWGVRLAFACARCGGHPALNALAAALRQVGRCGPWRDEQLAVNQCTRRSGGHGGTWGCAGFGIATRAVHLVGLAPDGRMWVQRRSLTKPNHPGKWGHPDGRHGVSAGFTAPGAGA